MGEFFHGWRRKMGLLMLMMACGLMVVWIRSQRVEDHFNIFHGRPSLCVASADGGLFIDWYHCNCNTTLEPLDQLPLWRSIKWRIADRFRFHEAIIEPYTIFSEEFREPIWMGFGYTIKNHNFTIRIPLGSIVIPLTLLSAWLLLNKPRVEQRSCDL